MASLLWISGCDKFSRCFLAFRLVISDNAPLHEGAGAIFNTPRRSDSVKRACRGVLDVHGVHLTAQSGASFLTLLLLGAVSIKCDFLGPTRPSSV